MSQKDETKTSKNSSWVNVEVTMYNVQYYFINYYYYHPLFNLQKFAAKKA